MKNKMSNHYLVPIDELGYDPTNELSVLQYAKKLIGKSMNQVLQAEHQLEQLKDIKNKGGFGELVEELYFHIGKNNTPEPDIRECGIEIKTGRFNILKNAGKSVDQRLKLGSIDYLNSFNSPTLFDNPLWKKAEKILLIMFIRSFGNRLDEVCDYVERLNYPEEDMAQFASDWLTIKEYVTSGKANELSESSTHYLAACTSGKDSTTLVNAPGGNDATSSTIIKAKQRSFSFKQSYMNELLGLRSKKVRTGKLIIPKDKTLEEVVLAQLANFFTMKCSEICKKFHIDTKIMLRSKARYSLLSKNITWRLLSAISDKSEAGMKINEYEQFKKAGIKIKTIALEKDMTIAEHMSFPAIDWVALDNEECWEESVLYEQMNIKYLFVVFKKDATDNPLNSILLNAFFWSMPTKDMNEMKSLWGDTKKKVSSDDYSNFIKPNHNAVGHIRPHAKNSKDLALAPRGRMEKKLSFWLNKKYILNIIKSSMN